MGGCCYALSQVGPALVDRTISQVTFVRLYATAVVDTASSAVDSARQLEGSLDSVAAVLASDVNTTGACTGEGSCQRWRGAGRCQLLQKGRLAEPWRRPPPPGVPFGELPPATTYRGPQTSRHSCSACAPGWARCPTQPP